MEIKGQISVEREEMNTRLRERDGHSETQTKNSTPDADGKRDRAIVSEKAQEIYQSIQTRSERIEAIKKAVDAGDYSINLMHVARKVMDEI